MNKINPCKGCKDRSAECHAACKRYKKWLDEHIRNKHEQHKEKHPEVYDYIVDRRYRGKNSDQR